MFPKWALLGLAGAITAVWLANFVAGLIRPELANQSVNAIFAILAGAAFGAAGFQGRRGQDPQPPTPPEAPTLEGAERGDQA